MTWLPDPEHSVDPPRVVWVVGEPGIGKTTWCRKFFHGPATYVTPEHPKFTEFGPGKVAVGTWEDGKVFAGGDTVSPSYIKPALERYVKEYARRPYTVFDGAKFANMNAVRFIEERVDAELCLIYLVGPNAAAAGRAARGSAQSESWIKGMRTKAQKFADAFAASGRIHRIDRDAEGASS